MKHIALLLMSASLACAELTPGELNELKHWAIAGNFYYSGVITLNGLPYYRLTSKDGTLCAIASLEVTNLHEAQVAILSSTATARAWITSVEASGVQVVGRQTPSPSPPPGWELE
jgi:hypothetical protein